LVDIDRSSATKICLFQLPFNARRARIGVVDKFLGDWDDALIYDFGGSSDGFGGTARTGGTAVGFLPGGGLSGI
jgi:phosphate-selective porin OprO/OprP